MLQPCSRLLLCRISQNQLMSGSPEVIATILDRVEHDLAKVITDMFGNYFVQALFRVCADPQRERVLLVLEPVLADIACDRNGTYALQSIVEQVPTEADKQIDCLRRGLAPHALRVIMHDQGTHVIQRFQKRFAASYCDFVHSVAKVHCIKLATNPNGVSVLLLCIDTGSRKLRVRPALPLDAVVVVVVVVVVVGRSWVRCRWHIAVSTHLALSLQTSIITEVVQNAVALSKHPYANYVVQHMMDKRNRGLRLSSIPGLCDDPDLGANSVTCELAICLHA